MKRICYLLTFFLTGFSLVANQESLSNTYLVACNDEFYEINLGQESENNEISEIEEGSGFIRHSFPPAPGFICFARD